MSAPPDMTLSHLELYVADVARMEAFYTGCLGFVVTDRGEGAGGLVFLSRSPGEHHQVVLNPRAPGRPGAGPLDHVALRVRSLADVRAVHASLAAYPDCGVQAVSHGSTWSLYFRDPEGNRLEVFADTPWHVDQPCGFRIDLALDDAALHAATRAAIEGRPGFREAAAWRREHAARLAPRGDGDGG